MPIVDCHATLEGNLIPAVSQNASQLVELLAQRGIERAIVMSARAARLDPLAGNRLLKEMLAESPGLFACLTTHVNRVDSSIQAARELLGGRRFVCVMLTSTDPSTPLQPLVADEILNACRRYQKPIFLPSANGSCVEVALKLAKTYTMHKFILMGMGGTDLRTAIAAAQQAANIYLETSGSMDRSKIPAAIEAVGSHRLLFGSGLPDLDPVAALGLLEDADVRGNDRRRILFDNAEKLFDLQEAAAR